MTRLAEVALAWAGQLALGGYVYYTEGPSEKVATAMLIIVGASSSLVDWDRQSTVWLRLLWIPLIAFPALLIGSFLRWDIAVFVLVLLYLIFLPDWSLLRRRRKPKDVP